MQNIIGFFLAIIITLTSAQSSNNQRRETMKSPFSIGLGVLSPSYSQKIGGSGSLDVMQDNSGFSYALNNVAHPSSSLEGRIVNDERVSYGPQYQFKSTISQGTGSKQTNEPLVSIYHTQTPSAPSKSDSYAPYSYQSEDDGSYQPAIPETRVQPSRQQYDGNTQQRQYFQIEQNSGNFQSLQSYQQPQRQKFEVSQPGIFSVQSYEQPRSEAQVQPQSYQQRGPLSSILSAEPQGYEQPKPFSSYSSSQAQGYEPRPYSSYSPFQPQNYDQPKNVESISSAQPQSIEIPKSSYSPQNFDLTKSLAFDSVEPQQASYQPSPPRQSYQPITFQSAPDRVNLQPLIPEKYLTPFNAPQASAARDNDGRYGNFDLRQQISHQPPQTFQHSFTF